MNASVLPGHRACSTPGIDKWSIVVFLIGASNPFTVSVVGKVPVSELIISVVVLWLSLLVATNRRVSGSLFRLNLFWVFAAAQLLSLSGYIVSDLIRESELHDALRGWARCAFLLCDTIAMVYLIERSIRFLPSYLLGYAVGQSAFTLLIGPLANDYWKFGFGMPLTLIALLAASCFGLWPSVIIAMTMAFVHLWLDFRSMSVLCFIVGAGLTVGAIPQRLRALLLSVGGVALLVLIGVMVLRSGETSSRAQRSNIIRQAMMQAAAEAFLKSPWIGQGSWFSKSDVVSNFEAIRWDMSQRLGGGHGFAREGDEEVAVHSEILASLAEGGILGGGFFVLYLAFIIWALIITLLRLRWNASKPATLFILLGALCGVLFNPYSGSERVGISLTVALILLLRSNFVSLQSPANTSSIDISSRRLRNSLMSKNREGLREERQMSRSRLSI